MSPEPHRFPAMDVDVLAGGAGVAEAAAIEALCPGPAAPGRWRSVRLAGRVVARPPRLRLDLNGVVKALAVDDALALVEGPGFVSAGGDVAVRGGAVVGLPRGGSVRVEDGGVATS